MDKPKFAAAKAPVLGFLRTEGDADEIASRKTQSELINLYASNRGFPKPLILGTASRADLERLCIKGSTVIVPKISSLLRKPSDVSEIVDLMVKREARIHCVETGSEIGDSLSIIRSVSECFAPLEARISELEATLKRERADHDAEITATVQTVKAAMLQRVTVETDDTAALKSKAQQVFALRQQAANYLVQQEQDAMRSEGKAA